METEYGKVFPELMVGKKIMYVHGFMSSGQTNTAKLLRRLLPQATVVAEDIPIHPAEAMELLHRLCEAERPDLIIGTSMGGMYTEMLRGVYRIVVNPAFQMGQAIKEGGMSGRQVFQNPRKDGVQEIIVTKSLEKEYAEITTHCFRGITADERERVYGLFGDRDPLVHTFGLFREHYPNAIRFHGEHRLTDSILQHYVVPVIRWIDDKQTGRERPVVYIDYDSVVDERGNVRSSLHKAYELLLDHYDVYFVARAHSDEGEAMLEAQRRIEDIFSAPAFNRVVYTSNPSLLYGDYYIGCNPPDGSMATAIEFGSEEFKAWEEIIVYFSRLGGQ